MEAAVAEGRGAFLLGAHIGSFEALHAIGDILKGLRVAMVMYPHNAQKIHAVLQAIAPNFELGIIAIGERGSTLVIRDWLDSGGLAGLLGDRFLPHASSRAQASVALPFLGTPAHFTDGPLRLAMLLKRRVVFMVGLYQGGRRYDVRFDILADFSQPPSDPAEREAQIAAALLNYVQRLEALCREAPYNWFNFYDFWQEDAALERP
jgi:predicted LPLAT superfamily acyltransferase